MHVSTRQIFDERASERRGNETMSLDVVSTTYCPRYFPPSVTPPPHTNVAISRRADDDDMMTSKQQSGNGQNKTQQTVKGCSVWYRSPHRNKQYTSILYIHHDRYYVGP